MAIAITKQLFIERVRKHMADGWPNNDFSITENEVLLYLDAAIAQTIVALAYNGAKIDGELSVAEAFVLTFTLPVPAFDVKTGEYSVTLPQTPLSLPLGHSVQSVYFGGDNGRSQSAYLIKGKRVSYRADMPLPRGVRVWFEGSTMKMATSNGQPLNPAVNTLYITMPSARTTDVMEPMNVPDDAMPVVFDYVVKQLSQRMGIPKDIIADGLTAGNKQG